jgi:predicted lipoprotein with Yx(FWY)xxD motif
MVKAKESPICQSSNTVAVVAFVICVVVVAGAGLMFYLGQSNVGKIPAKEADSIQPVTHDPRPKELKPKTKGAVNIRQDEILGPILVAENGMTLYISKDDADGVSNCDEVCAVSWPPLTITTDLIGGEGVTGTLALLERADGQKQVTYNGMPLYFWKNDKSEGDATGHGIKDIWSVVTP